MGLIRLLLGWLTGGGIAAIGKEINNWKKIKEESKNNSERIEAETQIKQLELQQEVLIREQSHWSTRWIRPVWAGIFIIYDFKIVVWDKVLGLGTTDSLPAEFWNIQMVMIGAYFITRPFDKKRF